MLVAAGVFALAVAGVSRLQTALIPEISEGEFYFEATMPEGTPVEATDRAIGSMAAPLASNPDVEVYYSTAGSRLVSGGMSLSTTAEHYGQLNVVLADRRDEGAEERVASLLREPSPSSPISRRSSASRPTSASRPRSRSSSSPTTSGRCPTMPRC